jgi:hypothetical protein
VAPPHAPAAGEGRSLGAEDGWTDADADADDEGADEDEDDGEPATAEPDGDPAGVEGVADGVHAAATRTAPSPTERAERANDGIRIGGESSEARPRGQPFATPSRETRSAGSIDTPNDIALGL